MHTYTYLFLLICTCICIDVETRATNHKQYGIKVRKLSDKNQWKSSLIEAENSNPLKLDFTKPAKHWSDAVPIGNGKFGAMIWGGVANETLNLNGMFLDLSVWLPRKCRGKLGN